MKSTIAQLLRSAVTYVLEFAIFFALAYVAVHCIDPSKAMFLAGLSLFFLLCACLIDRPAAPHLLLSLLVRPMILIMSIVVVGFGALGTREPDLTVFAPAFALALLGAAFANCLDRSRQRKSGKDA